jgi:serine/threonine-protein kinase
VGVLEALRAVHEQRDDEGNPLGLFFREISPLNVLLSLDGRALLSDLAGLRVITSERLWASPRVNLRGFYLYESPELLQGQPRAVRDDLWSAAMILWTLISGVPVFLRDSDFASLHDLMTGKRRLFAELGPNLPPPLIATLERALHHDPARRHATAAELLDDLRASAPVAVASEIAAWALSHGAARLEESEPRRPGAPRPEPDDEGEALGYRSAPQARAPAAPRVPHRPASSPVSPSRWRRWWRWGRRS